MQRKRRIIIGAATVATLALAGGAYAATQSSSPRQAYLNDVAKRLGVSPQALSSAMQNATIDQLNAAVKAGRLTQAQASAIEHQIQKGGAAGPSGFGAGPMGRGAGFGAAGSGLGAAASYLGVSQAQLLSDLKSGKTLAQVASSSGKSVSRLEAAIESAVKADLQKAVSQKQITSAQETQALNALSTNIAGLVTGSSHGLGAFHGPGGGPPWSGSSAGSGTSSYPGTVPPAGYGPPAGLF